MHMPGEQNHIDYKIVHLKLTSEWCADLDAVSIMMYIFSV